MLTKIRSETIKRFEQRQILIINEFVDGKLAHMKLPTVRKMIWELTSDPKTALETMDIALYHFTRKQVKALRSELVHQFQEIDPWLNYEIYKLPLEGESKSVEELRKAFKFDGVIICEIMRGMERVVFNESYDRVNKIIRLLRSEEIQKRNGGLSAMGFGINQRRFFVAHTPLIADVLESYYCD